MTELRKNFDSTWIKILIALIPIGILSNLGYTSWAAVNSVDNSKRISVIEGNRFTAADGLDIWKEIGKIKEILAQMPKEVPPKWFLDRFNVLEQKVDKIQEDLIKNRNFIQQK